MNAVQSSVIDILLICQAVIDTGRRFRETILALGGGKAPLEVSCNYWQNLICISPLFLLPFSCNSFVYLHTRCLWNFVDVSHPPNHCSVTMVYYQLRQHEANFAKFSQFLRVCGWVASFLLAYQGRDFQHRDHYFLFLLVTWNSQVHLSCNKLMFIDNFL